MPRYITVPGKGSYKFPDGTTDKEIYSFVDELQGFKPLELELESSSSLLETPPPVQPEPEPEVQPEPEPKDYTFAEDAVNLAKDYLADGKPKNPMLASIATGTTAAYEVLSSNYPELSSTLFPEISKEEGEKAPIRVEDIYKGVPIGALRLGESAVLGATGALSDRDIISKETADSIQKTAKNFTETYMPEYSTDPDKTNFVRMLSEGAGSFASFFVPGTAAAKIFGIGAKALGAGAKTIGISTAVGGYGTSGILASASGAGIARQRALDAGVTDPEILENVTNWGLGIGLLDIIPVSRFLKGLPPAEQRRLKDKIASAVKQGGVEAAQEAASQFAQNAVAKGYYNPSQKLIASVGDDAAVGFSVGAITAGIMDFFGGKKARKIRALKEELKKLSPLQKEKEYIDVVDNILQTGNRNIEDEYGGLANIATVLNVNLNKEVIDETGKSVEIPKNRQELLDDLRIKQEEYEVESTEEIKEDSSKIKEPTIVNSEFTDADQNVGAEQLTTDVEPSPAEKIAEQFGLIQPKPIVEDKTDVETRPIQKETIKSEVAFVPDETVETIQSPIIEQKEIDKEKTKRVNASKKLNTQVNKLKKSANYNADAVKQIAIDYYNEDRKSIEKINDPKLFAEIKNLTPSKIQKKFGLKPLEARKLLTSVNEAIANDIIEPLRKKYKITKDSYKDDVIKRKIKDDPVFKNIKTNRGIPKTKTAPAIPSIYSMVRKKLQQTTQPTNRPKETTDDFDLEGFRAFRGTSEGSSIAQNLDDIQQNTSFSNFVEKTKNLGKALKEGYLTNLGQLDNIVRKYGFDLKPLYRIRKGIRGLSGDITTFNSEVSRIAGLIKQYQSDNIKNNKYKLLDTLLNLSTLSNLNVTKILDPNVTDQNVPTDPKRQEAYKELLELYNQVGIEGQQIYNEIGNYFSKYYNELLVSLRNRLKSYGIDPEVIRTNEELKKLFSGTEQLNFYYPQKRTGQHWVNFKINGTFISTAFGNPIEAKNAEEYLIKLEKEGKVSDINSFQKSKKRFDFVKSDGDRVFKQLENTQKIVNEELKKLVPADKRNEVLESIAKDFTEFYVKNSPQVSLIRSALMNRKGTLGARGDILEVFVSNARPLAQQLARYRNATDIDVGISNLNDTIDKIKNNNLQSDFRIIQNAVELMAREAKHPSVTDYLRGLHNKLGQVGFLWYLGNFASIMNQLFQLPAYSLTMLQAKYGVVNTSAALLGALRDLSPKFLPIGAAKRDVELKKYKYTDRNNNVTETYERMPTSDNITEDEKKALVRATAEGTISRVMVGDIGGYNIEELTEEELQESAKYSSSEKSIFRLANPKNLTLSVATFLMHGFGKLERFNREVTFLAAYRLAKKEPKKLKVGRLGDASRFSTPFEYATEMTLQSQGNYYQQNWGKWFQGSGIGAVTRPALMFKKYPLLMMDVFYDTIRRTEGVQSIIPFRDKKEKFTQEEKEEATKMAGGLFLGNMALFGLNGLPLFWAAAYVTELALYMLKDDDEPYYGFDGEKFIEDYFDTFLGIPNLSKGLVEKMSQLAVSERLGVGGPLFFPPRYTDGIFNQTFEVLGGPMVGLGFGARDSLLRIRERYEKGDRDVTGFLRDLEAAAPSFVRYIAQAYRISEEGITARNGISLLSKEELKNEGLTVFVKALGYNTTQIAEMYDLRGRRFKADNIVKDERNLIQSQIIMAFEKRDEELFKKAKKRALKFNKKYRGNAKPIDITRSFSAFRAKNKKRIKTEVLDHLLDPKGIQSFEGIPDLNIEE